MKKQLISWVAVDWGTSYLRAWAMTDEQSVLFESKSDRGMGKLTPNEFEQALLELIEPWLTQGKKIPVIACGMVGARQGWIETPYEKTPCSPFAKSKVRSAPVCDPRIVVSVLPGLCQMEPADIMRGEETQVAGLLAERPDFQGIVCMPGTHTKWVKVQNGKVVKFTSCMTGELFSLLEQHSILKYSLQSTTTVLHIETYKKVFVAVFRNDEPATSSLFSLRAENILNNTESDICRAKLSAYLIAAELKATHSYWFDANVVLIGSQELVELYRFALSKVGAKPEVVDGAALTLSGLCSAKSKLSQKNEIKKVFTL